MRIAHVLTIGLLTATGMAVASAWPLLAHAQSSDPDEEDDGDGGDDDDDGDVPDPDDPAEEPGDPDGDPGDAGGDPDDGGGDAPGDAGGGGDDDGGDAPDAPGGGGDDDDGASGADGADDDDAPAGGGATGGGGSDDDDGADDDDDAPPGGAAPPSGNDDDDDDDVADGGGDGDDGGAPGSGGADDGDDDDIIGGGDESEAERLALDERDGIETDREGFRYRAHEFVALDLDAGELGRLQASGFTLIRSDSLGQLGGTVHLLRGPRNVADEAAQALIEEIADPGSLSFNHLFDSSSARVRRVRTASPEVQQRTACGCQIGLIDTGVANTLPSFRHVAVEQRSFNGAAVTGRLHGTAVAHLFAGTRARPREATRVVVADIFSGERGSAGSTYALVRALDWLASRNIPVINISLSGPRNPVVASTIARLATRGHIIVAAAGNDGPAAPPVFPGAYQNVVAVTAVDDSRRIYRYANRGSYVDFAARGVNVLAINARGEATAATGTSFAAPIVAARLAARHRTVDPAAARRAIAELEGQAQDLGDPGRDAIYGIGLVPDAP